MYSALNIEESLPILLSIHHQLEADYDFSSLTGNLLSQKETLNQYKRLMKTLQEVHVTIAYMQAFFQFIQVIPLLHTTANESQGDADTNGKKRSDVNTLKRNGFLIPDSFSLCMQNALLLEDLWLTINSVHSKKAIEKLKELVEDEMYLTSKQCQQLVRRSLQLDISGKYHFSNEDESATHEHQQSSLTKNITLFEKIFEQIHAAIIFYDREFDLHSPHEHQTDLKIWKSSSSAGIEKLLDRIHLPSLLPVLLSGIAYLDAVKAPNAHSTQERVDIRRELELYFSDMYRECLRDIYQILANSPMTYKMTLLRKMNLLFHHRSYDEYFLSNPLEMNIFTSIFVNGSSINVNAFFLTENKNELDFSQMTEKVLEVCVGQNTIWKLLCKGILEDVDSEGNPKSIGFYHESITLLLTCCKYVNYKLSDASSVNATTENDRDWFMMERLVKVLPWLKLVYFGFHTLAFTEELLKRDQSQRIHENEYYLQYRYAFEELKHLIDRLEVSYIALTLNNFQDDLFIEYRVIALFLNKKLINIDDFSV